MTGRTSPAAGRLRRRPGPATTPTGASTRRSAPSGTDRWSGRPAASTPRSGWPPGRRPAGRRRQHGQHRGGSSVWRSCSATPRTGCWRTARNSAWFTSVAEDLAVDANGGIYLAYTYGSTGANGYVDKYKTAGHDGLGAGNVTVAGQRPVRRGGRLLQPRPGHAFSTSAAPGVLANDTITAPNNPRAVLTYTSARRPPARARHPRPQRRRVVHLHPDRRVLRHRQLHLPDQRRRGEQQRRHRGPDRPPDENAAPVAVDDSYTVTEDTPSSDGPVAGGPAGNSLSMTSDAGRLHRPGARRGATGRRATFTMDNPYPSNPAYSNAVALTSRPAPTGGTSTSRPRTTTRFVAGTDVHRGDPVPVQRPASPGMDVSGNGRGSTR